jgi:ketosteroid isomerase-like protein
MYHLVARQMARRFYGKLNQGDYEWIVRRYAPHMPFGHKQEGNGALGGTRHSPAAAHRWFQRLFALIPTLHVEIKEVIGRGGPWHVALMIEWVASGTCADGQPFHDTGVQVVHIRWGRIIGARWYHDTQAVAEACQRMAQNGIKEADGPPIED